MSNVLNALQSAWDTDKKVYNPGKGNILVDGVDYRYEVRVIDDLSRVSGAEADLRKYPTDKRVVTEVIRDSSMAPDIVVPLLPGWGETSAQMEGDFLECLLKVLAKKGYKNPKIIGVNCCGKGTEEYIDQKDVISGVGLWDGINDAWFLAKYLDRNGSFGDNVTLVGHSMGVFDTIAFLLALEADSEVDGAAESVRKRVKNVLHFMPVTDRPYGMFRLKFLTAVRKQIWPAMMQYFSQKFGVRLSRKGYMDLSERDHARIMFADYNEHPDPGHFERGVPDSARRFLELTFNSRRLFEPSGRSQFPPVFGNGTIADGRHFTVVEGGMDNLIPVSAVKGWFDYIKAGNPSGKTNLVECGIFSHAIPFQMLQVQKDAMKAILEIAI